MAWLDPLRTANFVINAPSQPGGTSTLWLMERFPAFPFFRWYLNRVLPRVDQPAHHVRQPGFHIVEQIVALRTNMQAVDETMVL